jgi:anti-sigma factor RsiW
MKGRILDFVRPAHRYSQELLPWYATGHLDEDQRLAVEAHLQGCAACRQDLQWERGLHALVGQPSPPADVEAGLALMRRRLDEPASAAERIGRELRRGLERLRAYSAPWVTAAALAQLVAIAGLSWLLHERAEPVADYRTLGAAAVPADLLVAFDPALREGDMERLLHELGARIVGGPNAAGGYLLAVSAGQREAVLARLRHDRRVRLAEPLQGGPSP